MFKTSALAATGTEDWEEGREAGGEGRERQVEHVLTWVEREGLEDKEICQKLWVMRVRMG